MTTSGKRARSSRPKPYWWRTSLESYQLLTRTAEETLISCRPTTPRNGESHQTREPLADVFKMGRADLFFSRADLF